MISSRDDNLLIDIRMMVIVFDFLLYVLFR